MLLNLILPLIGIVIGLLLARWLMPWVFRTNRIVKELKYLNHNTKLNTDLLNKLLTQDEGV